MNVSDDSFFFSSHRCSSYSRSRVKYKIEILFSFVFFPICDVCGDDGFVTPLLMSRREVIPPKKSLQFLITSQQIPASITLLAGSYRVRQAQLAHSIGARFSCAEKSGSYRWRTWRILL